MKCRTYAGFFTLFLSFMFFVSSVSGCQGEQSKRASRGSSHSDDGNLDQEYVKIQFNIAIEDTTINLDFENLTYKLTYLALGKEGKIKFKDYESRLNIKQFPAEVEGEFRFEVYEKGILKLVDIREDFLVASDETEMDVVLQVPEEGTEPPDDGQQQEPPAGRPIKDIHLVMPDKWIINQDAVNGDTVILGIIPTNTAVYLTFYARDITGLEIKKIFANGSTVVNDVKTETIGPYAWQLLETSKDSVCVASFLMEYKGKSYYGYARSAAGKDSLDAAKQFLGALK